MRPLTMCLVLPVFLGCGVWAEFVRSAQAAEYIYDDLGRLQAATDDPVAGSTAVWTYDPVGNLTGIVRQSATTLSIIDFSPKCGLPGGQVTISGSGYSPVSAQNTVTFNSLATGIMTATPTQLVVTIPGGPSSGLLTVTTPTGSTTSSQPFTVGVCGSGGLGAPTITGFSPTIAVPGTAVQISGTNFDPVLANNKIAFNGHSAAPTLATVTSLATVLPPTATSGRISVVTPAGKAVSSGDFFVPPGSATAADVQVADRMVVNTQKTVILSAAGKIGLIVFDGMQGQRVSLAVTASFPNGVLVSIRKPDDTTLAFAFNFFLDTQTLPVSGTYTIVVDPPGTDTGRATLTLYMVPPDVSGTLTLNGTLRPVSITTPGQNGRLTFAGSAGQKATVRITTNTMDSNGGVTVTLLDPSGTALTSKSSDTTNFNLSQKTLATTGTYTIVIDPKLTNTGSLFVQVTNP